LQKIKVAAYCRVSTDSSNQRNSYEAQVEYFNRELAHSEDFELYSIYADKGISGTKLRRAEFDRMLYDAGLDIKQVLNDAGDTRKNMVKYVTIPSATRKPKFKYILTKDASRLARNIRILDIIDDMRQVGVYVRFLDFDLCTERDDDLMRIRGFFDNSEWESRLKSKKVRWGFAESIRKNKVIHTNGKIYGYSYNQACNTLVIIPEEAEVIRKIFELYSQGIGVRRIANLLYEQGIKTRKCKRFEKNSLMRILTQEKYLGLNNRGKRTTGVIFQNKTYPKVQDEYMLEPNDKIPVIIEPELFKACQKVLHSKVNYQGSKGVYKGVSEYSDFVYCGKCGSVYHSNRYLDKRDGKNILYDYYTCAKRKKLGKSACDAENIRKGDIDTLIDELSTKLPAIVKQDWETALDKLTTFKYYLMAKIADNNTEQVQQLNAEIVELNRKMQKLLDAFTSDEILDKSIFAKMINELSTQLQQKQKVITELTRKPEEIIAVVDKTIINIEMLKNYRFEIRDSYTKEQIMEIVDRIIVRNDGVSIALDCETGKQYKQYVKLYGYEKTDGAMLFRLLEKHAILSDEQKAKQQGKWDLLEAKYNKIMSIYKKTEKYG
jgi:site-specific DNA recombinase